MSIIDSNIKSRLVATEISLWIGSPNSLSMSKMKLKFENFLFVRVFWFFGGFWGAYFEMESSEIQSLIFKFNFQICFIFALKFSAFHFQFCFNPLCLIFNQVSYFTFIFIFLSFLLIFLLSTVFHIPKRPPKPFTTFQIHFDFLAGRCQPFKNWKLNFALCILDEGFGILQWSSNNVRRLLNRGRNLLINNKHRYYSDSAIEMEEFHKSFFRKRKSFFW